MVDEEYIEEIMDKSENENTRNGTEYWKKVFKKWTNERIFQTNLEEYKSDVLDQIKHCRSFMHSEIQWYCPCVIMKKNSMDPRKIKNLYHFCFQKLLKSPLPLHDLGNFRNLWKHAWEINA